MKLSTIFTFVFIVSSDMLSTLSLMPALYSVQTLSNCMLELRRESLYLEKAKTILRSLVSSMEKNLKQDKSADLLISLPSGASLLNLDTKTEGAVHWTT